MFTEDMLNEYLADYASHDVAVLRDRWYTDDVEFETITIGLTQGIEGVLDIFSATMHRGQVESYDTPFVAVSADGERGAALLEGHRYYTQDRPDHGAAAGDKLNFAIVAIYRFRGDRVCYVGTGRLRFELNSEKWNPPPALRERLPEGV